MWIGIASLGAGERPQAVDSIHRSDWGSGADEGVRPTWKGDAAVQSRSLVFATQVSMASRWRGPLTGNFMPVVFSWVGEV